VRSRLLKTTVLTAAGGAIWTQMPQLTLRLNIGRRLSLKCFFLGHEDWIRRTSDRLYLECFECGRETRGWTTGRSHPSNRAADGRVQREPVNKRDDHSAPARPDATTEWPAVRAALAKSAPIPRPAPVMNQLLLSLTTSPISRCATAQCGTRPPVLRRVRTRIVHHQGERRRVSGDAQQPSF
jgi:hypothetical protein